MEKENVLEIEFQEVFDKIAWRIVYQNENIFKRGKFEDEELKVKSCSTPGFYFDTLLIRGHVDNYDDNIIISSKKDFIEIQKRVDGINKKYGIPKKWRAKKGEKYWFINGCYFDIFETTDNYEIFDKEQYDLGNYFRTKQEAQSKLDQIKQILGGQP